jgi:hypothetical protein
MRGWYQADAQVAVFLISALYSPGSWDVMASHSPGVTASRSITITVRAPSRAVSSSTPARSATRRTNSFRLKASAWPIANARRVEKWAPIQGASDWWPNK